MKSLFFTLVTILSVGMVSANNGSPIVIPVKSSESTIKWVGKKVLGSHEGTVKVKNGSLDFDGDKFIGGIITIDMTTINCTDLQAGQGKEKLETHLTSDDFFGTATHQEAKLNITKVISRGKSGDYKIIANLTIKGITKEIKFDAVVKDGQANANIVVDRTDFNVRYGSGSFIDSLGDKTIYDEFEMAVNLRF